MNSIKQLLMISMAAVALIGCQKDGEPEGPSSEPPAAEHAPGASAPEQAVTTAARSLAINLATDKVDTQDGVGEVQGGVLTGTGRAGYLMFGPYVPLAAGSYKVDIDGEVEEIPAGHAVTLDVASGSGAIVHGQAAISEVGKIPAFDVTLAEDVTNVEVRIAVAEGVKVTVRSYMLSPQP